MRKIKYNICDAFAKMKILQKSKRIYSFSCPDVKKLGVRLNMPSLVLSIDKKVIYAYDAYHDAFRIMCYNKKNKIIFVKDRDLDIFLKIVANSNITWGHYEEN